MKKAFVAATVAALALAGCSSNSAGEGEKAKEVKPSVTLNVFAAASLTGTFGELEKMYEEAHPEVDVVLNLAGSQDLVDQLASGAPADVLATANTSTMQKATDSSLASDPQVFATNTLVLVAPEGNPAGVTGMNESLAKAKLVICAPEVPCGKATKKLAEVLGVTLSPVSEEQAVTDVTGKVASGEADAGIVYKTDALAAGDKLDTVEIERASEVVNTYPIAVTASTKNKKAAQEFMDLVLSTKGRNVLTTAGFSTPTKH